MSPDSDTTKGLLGKHLTLNRYGYLPESTRIDSWPEQDLIGWELFLGQTLDPDMITPDALKTITDAWRKYLKAYGSYSFGVKAKLSGTVKYLLPVIAVVGVVFALYFMGYLR